MVVLIPSFFPQILSEFNSEKIMKIGPCLPKLLYKIKVAHFFETRCIYQVWQKSNPLISFPLFLATTWNFSVKFTSLYDYPIYA